MRRNSPFPRPAAVPPPSPPPIPLGFVRGFIGTMQPSDFSSAYMPIVRLLPSWVGRECWPDTDEISQVPTSASHLAGRMLPSLQPNEIGTSQFDPFRRSIPSPWSPCERFKLSLAASPCITRDRGGRLGLTRGRLTPPILSPACLARAVVGHTPVGTSASGHPQIDAQWLPEIFDAANRRCVVTMRAG